MKRWFLSRCVTYLNPIVVALLLGSCGGGGGGDGSSNSPPDSPVPLIETGVFVDSPVEGIEYQTQSQAGVTNANGEFQYRSGETVVFKIGSLIIGQANAKGIVTPIDLVPGADSEDSPESNPQVVKILQILQTLDSDGDPSNGIAISSATRASAEQRFEPNTNFQVLDLASDPEMAALVLDATGSSEIVSVEEAIAEFRQGLDDIAGDTLVLGGIVSGLESGESVDLRLNLNELLTISANGNFSFVDKFSIGAEYNISIISQPENTVCAIENASGTFASENISNIVVACERPQFSVGGSVLGLTGSLQLQLGAEVLIINSPGNFLFNTELSLGSFYSVSIVSQPVNQTCVLSGAQGVIPDQSVTSVNVSCSTNTYALGGDVQGLIGSLVLQNSNDIAQISSDGAFQFSAEYPSGTAYAVSVQSQPAGQICAVTNGAGTFEASDVDGVSVSCMASIFTVGGSVSGLQANENVSLVLNSNSQVLENIGNGSFTFPAPLTFGDAYSVEVADSSISTTCSIANGSGENIQQDISNISVSCSENAYVLGGQISGLVGDLVLGVGVEEKLFNAVGDFSFDQGVVAGTDFEVVVITQPQGQFCRVENGAGVMPESDTNTVQIDCANNYELSGRVTGLVGKLEITALACFDESCLSPESTQILTVQGAAAFTFPSSFPGGSNYVLSLSGNDACAVTTPGAGPNIGQTTSDILVECSSETSSLSISGQSYLNGRFVVQLQNAGGEVSASQIVNLSAVPAIDEMYLYETAGSTIAFDGDDFAFGPITFEGIAPGDYSVQIISDELTSAYTLNNGDYSDSETLDLIAMGSAGSGSTAKSCSSSVSQIQLSTSVSNQIEVNCGTPLPNYDLTVAASELPLPLLGENDLLSACLGSQIDSRSFALSNYAYVEEFVEATSGNQSVNLDCGCWQAEDIGSTRSVPGNCEFSSLTDQQFQAAGEPVIDLALWEYLVGMDIFDKINLIGNKLSNDDLVLLHAPYEGVSQTLDTESAFYSNSFTNRLTELNVSINAFTSSALWVDLWKISTDQLYVVPNSSNFSDIPESPYALVIETNLGPGVESVELTLNGNVVDGIAIPARSDISYEFVRAEGEVQSHIFGSFAEDIDYPEQCETAVLDTNKSTPGNDVFTCETEFPPRKLQMQLALPVGAECEVPNLHDGVDRATFNFDTAPNPSPAFLIDHTTTDDIVTVVGQGLDQSIDVVLFPGAENAVVYSESTFDSSTQLTRDFSKTISIACRVSDQYAIGGTVNGLADGSSVTIQNGMDQLVITSNDPFVFSQPQPEGTDYLVSVVASSSNQVCTVQNESGTVGAGDIDTVLISCEDLLLLSGTITGADSAVTLSQGAISQQFSNEFIWPQQFTEGDTYQIAVTAPPGQQCTPDTLVGAFSQTNEAQNIQCEPLYGVNVSISGNTGSVTVEDTVSGESLALNVGAEPQSLLSNLANGTLVNLSITDLPATQSCSVIGDTQFTIGGANVEATITCETLDTFSLGGQVTGHVGSLSLCSNASVDCETGQILELEGSTDFQFIEPFPEGTAFSITVLSNNPECAVDISTGSGTVTQNASDLLVTCNQGNAFSVTGELQSFLSGSLDLSLRRTSDGALASTVQVNLDSIPQFNKAYIYGENSGLIDGFSATQGVQIEFSQVPPGEYEITWDTSSVNPAVIVERSNFVDHSVVFDSFDGAESQSTSVACLADGGESIPVSVVSGNIQVGSDFVCGTPTTSFDLSDRSALPDPILQGTDLFSACFANADTDLSSGVLSRRGEFFVERFITGAETSELEQGLDVDCGCWQSEAYPLGRDGVDVGPLLNCYEGGAVTESQDISEAASPIIDLPLWSYLVEMDVLRYLDLGMNRLGTTDVALLHAPYIAYSQNSTEIAYYSATPTTKLVTLNLNLNVFSKSEAWQDLWAISSNSSFQIPNSRNFSALEDVTFVVQVDLENNTDASNIELELTGNINHSVDGGANQLAEAYTFEQSDSYKFSSFVYDFDDSTLEYLEMRMRFDEGTVCYVPNLYRDEIPPHFSDYDGVDIVIPFSPSPASARVYGRGTGVDDSILVQVFSGFDNAVIKSVPGFGQLDASEGGRFYENIVNISCEQAPEFMVGGSVSGLDGELQLAYGNEILNVTTNGSFEFITAANEFDLYSVSVVSQPNTQSCSIENASGEIGFADITNVTVTCETYSSLGGTISGAGAAVGLSDGTSTQSFANGAFTMNTNYLSGDNYTLDIVSEPAGQQCSPSSFSGTFAGSNIADISITCEPLYSLSVNVSGATGAVGIDQTQPVTDSYSVSANGVSALNDTSLRNGDGYVLSITSSPDGQSCSFNSESSVSGTVAGANIVVNLNCEDLPSYTLGGSVTGLIGELTLCSNNSINCSTGEQVTVEGRSDFQFSNSITSGTNYTITPINLDTENCPNFSVVNGSGVLNSDTSNIAVSCSSSEQFSISGNAQVFLNGLVTLNLVRSSDGALAATTIVDATTAPTINKGYIFASGVIDGDFAATKFAYSFPDVPPGTYDITWDTELLTPAVALSEDDFTGHDDIITLLATQTNLSTAVGCVSDAASSIVLSVSDLDGPDVRCGTPTTQKELFVVDGDQQLTPDYTSPTLSPNRETPLLGGDELFSACLSNTRLSMNPPFFGDDVESSTMRRNFELVEDLLAPLAEAEFRSGFDLFCGCWRAESFGQRFGFELPYLPLESECNTGIAENPFSEFFTPLPDSPAIDLSLWTYLVDMDLFTGIALFANQLGNDDLKLLHAPYTKYVSESDATTISGAYANTPTDKLEELDLNMNSFNDSSLWFDLWRISSNALYNVPNSHNFSDSADEPYVVSVTANFSGIAGGLTVSIEGPVSTLNNNATRETRSASFTSDGETQILGIFVTDPDIEFGGGEETVLLDFYITELPVGSECTIRDLSDPGTDLAPNTVTVSVASDVNTVFDSFSGTSYSSIPFSGNPAQPPIEISCSPAP